MLRSDVPDVMKLEKRVCSLPWNANAYITEIGNPSAKYLIAKQDNGALVGYGGVWVVMDEMHITTLAVDPTHRGAKVGERLLIELIFAGIERGAARATLEVREGNTAARNLYRKYGYADVAMRKRYYSDNGENAMIMWAEEINSKAFMDMMRLRLGEIERLHGA
jgi:ribosomal-protein-alanine N-acetyltransferase